MKKDIIDAVKDDWAEHRPDLDPTGMSITLRIQALAKIFDGQASESLETMGLKWWQYDVLSVLRRQGEPYTIAAGELAEACMLSTGAMTHRIDRLARKGWVVREPDSQDRRRVMVRLSDRGFELIEAASAVRFDAANEALECLSATEKRQMSDLLRQTLAEQ